MEGSGCRKITLTPIPNDGCPNSLMLPERIGVHENRNHKDDSTSKNSKNQISSNHNKKKS